MTTESTVALVEEIGSRPVWPDRKTDQIRSELSYRSGRVNEKFPRALDLESKVLAKLSRGLNGLASQLSGTHSDVHFRELLRGHGSAFPLYDLCRLALHPAREAREAVLAAISELVRPLGYRLVRIERALDDRLAELLRAADAVRDAMPERTR